MNRKKWIVVGAVSFAAYLAFPLSYLLGVRINTTASLPKGVYWSIDAPMEKGRIVSVCPTDSETFSVAMSRRYIDKSFVCESGYGLLLKRLLAAKGDHVRIGLEGVFVNGVRVPNSMPLEVDAAGRPLPRLVMDQFIQDDSVLLMGETPASFDSRYFGLLPQGYLQSVVRPVFTW